MAGRVTAPKIEIDIGACQYSEWRRFAPFHYLTAELNRSARTFAAYVNGEAVAFAGMLHRPVSRSKRGTPKQDLMGCSRLVTLPDWQGVGLAFALIDKVAAAYKAIGKRVHTYPAHPALIRSFDRSPLWALIGKPGFSMTQRGGTDKGRRAISSNVVHGWNAGTRPCATFRYVGPVLDLGDAQRLLAPYLR